MGQAKRRGAPDQRKELAIERKRVNDYLDNLCQIRKARMRRKAPQKAPRNSELLMHLMLSLGMMEGIRGEES